jgi:hypothetical protein
MNRAFSGLLAVAVLGAGVAAHAAPAPMKGKPEIRSMSALAFGPEGVLFVGDSRAGAVFAIDLGDKTAREVAKPDAVQDVEGKLAALLGATPADVLVHDMAVNPLSKNVYLAVSRGRALLASEWQLPNDVADATVLVKIDDAQRFSVVDLASVAYARLGLPNPVDPAKKHGWKEGISLRTETITDLAYEGGALFIAGLSNEEFASTMWRADYPFAGPVAATTIENYHGAHGKYETEAPVRAFVPFPLHGKTYLVAAYLCTPLVTFEASTLRDKQHVRGRTIGEFGSGNYPLDMVVYKNKDQQKLLIANSNLPFMIVDPKDVAAYSGEITTEVPGYTGGVRFESRSGTGVQQLDNLGDSHVVVLRRLMGGRLDRVPISVRRF